MFLLFKQGVGRQACRVVDGCQISLLLEIRHRPVFKLPGFALLRQTHGQHTALHDTHERSKLHRARATIHNLYTTYTPHMLLDTTQLNTAGCMLHTIPGNICMGPTWGGRVAAAAHTIGMCCAPQNATFSTKQPDSLSCSWPPKCCLQAKVGRPQQSSPRTRTQAKRGRRDAHGRHLTDQSMKNTQPFPSARPTISGVTYCRLAAGRSTLT